MNSNLLRDIEEFLAERRQAGRKLSEYRFGYLAAKNGRLVERLQEGRRVWPETEERIRNFIERERPTQ